MIYFYYIHFLLDEISYIQGFQMSVFFDIYIALEIFKMILLNLSTQSFSYSLDILKIPKIYYQKLDNNTRLKQNNL